MKSNDNASNICRFTEPPDSSYDDALTVTNLVRENEVYSGGGFAAHAVFKLYIVEGGKGSLTTLQQTYELSRGTVFVTFPAMPFYLTDGGGLKLMYVSFLGTKAYELLSERGVIAAKCVRYGHEDLLGIWQQTLSADNDTALAAEGLLYITLAHIGEGDKIKVTFDSNELANNIQRVIDDNYCDHALTLSFIAKKLNYNEKYVSTVFKKAFGTTIQNYIANLRLNNALKLISSGVTSIKDIAAFSGYSDPLYFSKAFKKYCHISPSESIKREARLKKNGK